MTFNPARLAFLPPLTVFCHVQPRCFRFPNAPRFPLRQGQCLMNQRNTDQHPGHTALLVLVILIGLNLRPFLTAIGPLSRDIADALALGMDTLAWLTLLPL
jgi:hypothetical protein